MSTALVLLLPLIEVLMGELGKLIVATIKRLVESGLEDQHILDAIAIVEDVQTRNPGMPDDEKRAAAQERIKLAIVTATDSTVNKLIELALDRIKEKASTP